MRGAGLGAKIEYNLLLYIYLLGAVRVTSDGPVVCSQNTVTFTCTVDHDAGLEWIVEPFITDEQNQVAFIDRKSVV